MTIHRVIHGRVALVISRSGQDTLSARRHGYRPWPAHTRYLMLIQAAPEFTHHKPADECVERRVATWSAAQPVFVRRDPSSPRQLA
jgi:hypothetical protein